MQILPSMDTARAFAGLRALSECDEQDSQRQAEAFRSVFEARLADDTDDAMGSGSSSVVASATQSSGGKAVQAGLVASKLLSSATGDVVTDPKTMRMTREDFAQLKESLKKYGFTDQEIEDLEARIDTSEGLTWASFMAGIQDKILGGETVVNISVEDKRQLQSLMGKLGFTTGETSQMIEDLEQGRSTTVWSQLSSRIQELSDETSLTITPAEAGALAEALGLSTDAQERLASFFARFGDSELSATDIRSALVAITAEVKDQKSAESQALAEVKELASEVFLAAQKRLFGQTLSDAREDQVSRKAMLAQEMAERSSQGDASGNTGSGNQSVADLAFSATDASGSAASGHGAQDDAAAGNPGKKRVRGDAQDGGQDGGQNGGRDGTRASGLENRESATEDGGAEDRTGGGQGKTFFEKAQASAQTDEEGGESEDWDAFWAKIGVDGLAGGGIMSEETVGSTVSSWLAGDLVGEEGLASATFSPTGGLGTILVPQPETAQNADRYVSADVLRQVENGMLRNLGQGGHRITLNLTPEDLGAVNVMLTVRDKDVQAVIRTETPEAARVIGEQLNRVRESLEQQGLKVSKLEVQTGLAGQDQPSWQGADSHNEARRQQEELSWSRAAMRLFGNEATSSEDTDVVAAGAHWSMHGEGLDLFA